MVSERPVGSAGAWLNSTLGPGDAVQTVVRVEAVYKGSIARRQAVVTQSGMCANSLRPPGAATQVVFANRQTSGALAVGCASRSLHHGPRRGLAASHAPTPGDDIPERPRDPGGHSRALLLIPVALVAGAGAALVLRHRATQATT